MTSRFMKRDSVLKQKNEKSPPEPTHPVKRPKLAATTTCNPKLGAATLCITKVAKAGTSKPVLAVRIVVGSKPQECCGFPGFHLPKKIAEPQPTSPVLDFPPLSSLNEIAHRPSHFYKIVSCLAYIKDAERFHFKCFKPDCTFVVCNEDEFVAHIHEKHHKASWSGMCVSCVAIVNVRPHASILDEWEHLLYHSHLPETPAVAN